MYQYPYGNAQQLNLDWILSKIQELEAGASAVNIEEVANTLISASFDAGVSYRRYDYCFFNGKLYRALNDTTGAFNPADWLEVVIGDDIPVLTRLINAVDTSLTTLQGQVADLDSDDVDNASTVTGTSVSDALETLNTAITNLQSAVGNLDSDAVDNASTVTGATVSAALNTLDGAISTINTNLNQIPYVLETPNNVECAANQYITLSTLSLTKGTWIFFATHAFTSGYAELYQDYIDDAGGTQLALVRNISMDSGGGMTIAGLYVASAATTINFKTYQRHTGGTVTANRIRFAAVKIHD